MLAGTQLMLNPELFVASAQTGPEFVTATAAEADLVGSSAEVALTTPWPTFVAVNEPLLSIVPTEPVAVQVTPACDPVTLAVNCCLPPTLTIMLAGVTVTAILPPPPPLVTLTWALADFVGSSTEVAVTVPVPGFTALYCPVWSIFPTLVALHVTPFVELAAFATNVCCCPAVNEVVVGDIVMLIVVETKLPIRYVASNPTALVVWPTLLNAVVAFAPQNGVIGPAPAGCKLRYTVTL